MPINGRMKLHDIKKLLKLKFGAGLSVREIEKVLKKPKSTVYDYIARFKSSKLSLEELEAKTEDEIYASLFPEESKRPKQRLKKVLPDFAQIHLELKKKYVTRQLLWEEYKAQYPDNHYGFTHFCNLYRNWEKRANITMRINHKAGDKMFMDFSGLTWNYIDKDTGELIDVEIFVATLAASGYTYAQATMNQTKPALIGACVKAFEFFKGCTNVLVPDYVPRNIINTYN